MPIKSMSTYFVGEPRKSIPTLFVEIPRKGIWLNIGFC